MFQRYLLLTESLLEATFSMEQQTECAQLFAASSSRAAARLLPDHTVAWTDQSDSEGIVCTVGAAILYFGAVHILSFPLLLGFQV